MPPPNPQLRVILAKQREHLPRIYELEQAAAADRCRIYEGVPWTVGGFKEYLRKGSALVCLSRDYNVIGYACYGLSEYSVDVPKLVAQTIPAEAALLNALWEVKERLVKQFLNLPLILELGTANV